MNVKLWNEVFHSLPLSQQDIYFTPEYYKLYEQNEDGKAQCFIFEFNGDFALYPFLKNEINSLGYKLNKKYYDIQGAYGYNGVVATSFQTEFVDRFYKDFQEYCINENIVAEFTRFHPIIKNKTFSERYLQIYFDRKTIYVDLRDSYEKIFSKFQTTTRKQIKRAINRYDIRVEHYKNDIEQLEVFTQIYMETMDRVGSSSYLYFNKEYFKSLLINTPNICFIAYHEEKPIASIIAFYNQYYLHGHLGGALTEYLFMSPYSILYAELIKFGITNGCFYFHVGGGASNNEDDPLFRYKMNFSNTTSDFYIGKKIHNPEVYNNIINIWEKKYPEKKENLKNIVLKYRF